MPALTQAERLDWWRLAHSDHVGPVGFRQLMARYGSAAAALDALPGLAAAAGRSRPLRIPGRGDAERELERHARRAARLIALADPEYPQALAAVTDAPPLFTLVGEPALLGRPMVALVGARNASVNGRKLAEMLARDFAAQGIVVVSGLARGIDGAAHGAALSGGTVAVIAGGADIVYPPEHAALQAAIAERGAIVAEQPFGTAPHARHFPRRNRIISGLSLGVVVVEAALRSGSLITARFAAEQGRDVFAVPGSPLDPRCRGSNGLLRDGAHLVETADDVLPLLGAARVQPAPEPPPAPVLPVESELPAVRRAVLEMLDPHPVPVDELIRRCHFSAAALLTVLLELELAGRLDRHPGNRVSLIAGS